MSRENTVSQMMLYARYLTFLDKEFDYDERIKFLDGITYKDVSDVIDEYFDITKASVATVGSKRSAIKI